MCFLYDDFDEDSRHKFICCPVTKSIWIGISQVWGSLTGNVLSPFQWVFIEADRFLPSPAIKLCLIILGTWACGIFGTCGMVSYLMGFLEYVNRYVG